MDDVHKNLCFAFATFKEKIVYSKEVPVFQIVAEPIISPTYQMLISDNDFEYKNVKIVDKDIFYTCECISGIAGYDLKVSVHLEHNGVEVTGTICIDKIRGLRVVQVKFPYIVWEDVEPFDNLLVASSWGDDIPRPLKSIKEFCSRGGIEDIYPGLKLEAIKTGDNEIIYTYPSVLSMQFMTLHNSSRAVYIACYSTGEETLTLNAGVLKKLSRECLGLSVNHYPFMENGKWQSPECGFAILQGDWHAAADLYAGHMRGKFTPPVLPEWIKNGFHGWVQILMQFEHEIPLFRYCDIPALFKKILPTGMNIIHIAAWNGRGHDTLYPDYDINPELGTLEEMQAALEEVKAMGGRSILYTNGRLVDPDSEFYKNGGSKSVCMDKNGETYTERYFNSVTFNVACPACEDYRSYLTGQIRRLYELLGAQGVQIDQISCNQGYLCYDKNHGHPTPATNFLPGVDREMLEVRNMHKSIHPDLFTWIEGCNERFGQYYDINQGHGEGYLSWQIGRLVPELFRYVYPQYIITGASSTVQTLCHSFAQGKPFDVGIAALENQELFKLLNNFVVIRKSLPQYFLNGIFRDNSGIDAVSGVRVYGIEKSDGKGLMVNFWKEGASLDNTSSAAVKNPRAGWRINTIYPPAIQRKENGSWLEFEWTGPVASITFEE